MGVYAYSEAARLLEQAVPIQEVLDPDDKVKRCDLLLALGEAILPAKEPGRAAEAVAPEALALAEPWATRAARPGLACWRWRPWSEPEAGDSSGYRTSEFGSWAEKANQYAAEGTVDRVYADIYLALHAFSASGPPAVHALLRRAVPSFAWFPNQAYRSLRSTDMRRRPAGQGGTAHPARQRAPDRVGAC